MIKIIVNDAVEAAYLLKHTKGKLDVLIEIRKQEGVVTTVNESGGVSRYYPSQQKSHR